MATEPSHQPTFSTLDLGAEAKKAWGPKWGAPEIEYEFEGRTFTRQVRDIAVYVTSPDFPA